MSKPLKLYELKQNSVEFSQIQRTYVIWINIPQKLYRLRLQFRFCQNEVIIHSNIKKRSESTSHLSSADDSLGRRFAGTQMFCLMGDRSVEMFTNLLAKNYDFSIRKQFTFSFFTLGKSIDTQNRTFTVHQAFSMNHMFSDMGFGCKKIKSNQHIPINCDSKREK